MRVDFLFALTLAFGCTTPAQSSKSADWPGFRGAGHDNTVLPAGLDVSLKDADQRIKWRKNVGLGYTVAASKDGLAYTAGWADGKTTVLCFNPDTGERVWGFDYEIEQYDERPKWPKSNEGGPVVTPGIAHGKLVHTTRDGRIFCLDAKTGELLWQKNFKDLFNVPEPRWGFSASPVIVGDKFYMDVGKIVAMDFNGNVLWQTKDYTQSYSSPTPFTYNGKDYLAAFPLDGLVVVERESGKVIAHHPWQSNQPVHAVSPLLFDGNKIFISSGWNTGAAVLAFTGEKLEPVWENKDLCNTMATSLYHDGHLYGFDQKVLRCVDAKTGETKWSQRGLGQGTLLAVGDTMLIMSEGGELMSAPMSPDAFKPSDKTRLIFETKVWSCPTISNGYLFARGARGDLVCVDLRKHE